MAIHVTSPLHCRKQFLCRLGPCPADDASRRPILEPHRGPSPATARAAPGNDGHALRPTAKALAAAAAAVGDAALTAGAGGVAAPCRMRCEGKCEAEELDYGTTRRWCAQRAGRPRWSHFCPAFTNVLAKSAVVGVGMSVGRGLA